MKGNAFITSELGLFFNAAAMANVADNASVAPLTNLFLALHTANPGAAGNQSTSEATYAGYARQPVLRTSGGFTVAGQSVSLAAAVTFPAAPTGATDILTFWSVGTLVSGAGQVFYSGPIGSNLGVGTGAITNIITIPGLTGVAVNDRITFEAPTGGAIPTGIVAGTVYFVLTVSGANITVSGTLAGPVVVITVAGQVLAYKVTPVVTGGGVSVTPQLTTGTTITEQ